MDKVILIDPTARTVELVDADLRNNGTHNLIGDYFDTAFIWREVKNVLYVDDNGMRKFGNGQLNDCFHIPGISQHPLVGRGVIAGRELVEYDRNGEDRWVGNDPPVVDVNKLRDAIVWLSRDQVLAWAKANASEPAVSITTEGANGKMHHEVLSTFGELFGVEPRHDK
jgi:hypothetical protein